MIPATVQSGSAVVSSAQGVAQSITVALSEAVFNVLTATCANCCFTCNGINTITVTANPFSCPVGLTVQLKATGNWNTGLTTDETSTATWSSSATSVATVETTGQTSPGLVSGLAPGSCTITALESNIDVPGHTCTGCPGFCPLGNRSGSSSGAVPGPTCGATSGIQGDVTRGSTVNCTVNNLPRGQRCLAGASPMGRAP